MGASSNQALLSIASTLCNLASIELRWGNFEEAGVSLEEALLVSYVVKRLCVEANVVAFFLTESRVSALLDSTICVGRRPSGCAFNDREHCVR
jgi:hypothetical protein